MGWWITQGWPVHGSTMDSIVADSRGSLELGLTAALGHGSLPRVWKWEGRDMARPGDRSLGLGRWRGGGTPRRGFDSKRL
jgi:hypothetical protein